MVLLFLVYVLLIFRSPFIPNAFADDDLEETEEQVATFSLSEPGNDWVEVLSSLDMSQLSSMGDVMPYTASLFFAFHFAHLVSGIVLNQVFSYFRTDDEKKEFLRVFSKLWMNKLFQKQKILQTDIPQIANEAANQYFLENQIDRHVSSLMGVP